MKMGNPLGWIALLLAIAILWEVRQLVLMVVAAIVLATSLNLFARKLQNTGMRRELAVVVSIGTLVGALTVFFWLVVPPFIEQFEQFLQLVPQTVAQVEVWLNQILARLPGEFFEPSSLNLNDIISQVQPIFNNFVETSFSVFSGTLGVVLNLILVVVLTLMFLASPGLYRHAFILLFPAFYRRRIDRVLDLSEQALSGWLVGVLFNMLVIAVLSWLSLWLILGIPLSLAHGIFAGLLTFIPNIGPALSVVPPMATAVLESPWKPLAVVVLYVIIQQVESNFLTPYVMAQQVSLLPAVTLVSQVVFATFFGFLGLLLALPITVVAQTVIYELLVKDILNNWQRGGESLPVARQDGRREMSSEQNSQRNGDAPPEPAGESSAGRETERGAGGETGQETDGD